MPPRSPPGLNSSPRTRISRASTELPSSVRPDRHENRAARPLSLVKTARSLLLRQPKPSPAKPPTLRNSNWDSTHSVQPNGRANSSAIHICVCQLALQKCSQIEHLIFESWQHKIGLLPPCANIYGLWKLGLTVQPHFHIILLRLGRVAKRLKLGFRPQEPSRFSLISPSNFNSRQRELS